MVLIELDVIDFLEPLQRNLWQSRPKTQFNIIVRRSKHEWQAIPENHTPITFSHTSGQNWFLFRKSWLVSRKCWHIKMGLLTKVFFLIFY